jgi:uncharacterized protein (TIGR01370 family)
MRARPDPRWVAAGVGLVLVLLVVAVVVLLGRRSDDGSTPAPTTVAPAGARTDPVGTAADGTGTTAPAPSEAPGPTPPPPPSADGPPSASVPAADTRTARLAQVHSWSFALGAAVSGRSGSQVAPQFKGFDLVVLDGVDTSADVVAALRAQGSIVLAYANVGAIEEGRPWTAAAAAYRLDYWDQWNEWYADVTKPGFRSLVTGTMVPPMLAKGFDGVFLDNVDMVDSHPAQRAAMLGLVAELSATVRGRGGYLFAQNGEDATVDALAPHLDGWNREDVSYTFDDESEQYVAVPDGDRRAALTTLRRLRSRGVLVTTIDYMAQSEGAEAQEALRAACDAGAVPSIGDIGLTRIFPPHRC